MKLDIQTGFAKGKQALKECGGKFMGISIIGCGHEMPKFAASNELLEEVVDTSNEWIVKRTGIKARRGIEY